MAVAILSTQDAGVEQSIDFGVEYHSKDLSPLWRMLSSENKNVTKPEWGRGYLVTKVFRTGTAGTGKFLQNIASQSTVIATTDTSNPNWNVPGEVAQQGWQSLNIQPIPGVFSYQFGLHKMAYDFPMPMELRRLAETNAARLDEFNAIIDGASENIAQMKCNALLAETVVCPATSSAYVLTLDGCVLAEVDLAATATTIDTIGTGSQPGLATVSAASQAVVQIKSGSIRRFIDGLPVDVVYLDVSADKVHILNKVGNPALCSRVDGLADKLTLTQLTTSNIASGITADTANDRCYIVPHGSLDAFIDTIGGATASDTKTLTATATWTPALPFSIDRLIKASGTVGGQPGGTTNGIDTARFPWAKSYIVDGSATSLDEQSLFRTAARYVHAMNSNTVPDSWWMTEGVLAAYANDLDGFYQWQRNGEKLDLMNQGVSDGIEFSAYGHVFNIMCDPFIGKGHVYGLVSRNSNYKRYVPPRMPDVGSSQKFSADLEFVGPALGFSNSIFVPALGSGSVTGITAGSPTDMLRCPIWCLYNIFPDVFSAVRFDNYNEDYGALG